jgi:hypothetical protein
MAVATEKIIPFDYGHFDAADSGVDEMLASVPFKLRYLFLNLWVFKVKTNFLSYNICRSLLMKLGAQLPQLS